MTTRAERMDGTITAMQTVTEQDDGIGTIPCPTCGKDLKYEKRSGSTREFQQGACTTPGCLRWIT